MPKPNFFIVGAQKCGTTAMYSYLEAHPEIFMPVVKEPHFFGSDNTDNRLQAFRGNLKKYLALFEDAGDTKRIGEASPSYLLSAVAAREIHEFEPKAKIIIMLRSPIEMVYSMYHHSRYMGDETAQTFREAITTELEKGIETHTNRTYSYLEVGQNSKLVARYFEVFPREQVHVIIFDDFVADLPRVFRETLEFLEVDPSFQPDFNPVNASKEPRNKTLQQVLETIGITPSHVRDSAAFRMVARVLPAPVYEFSIRQATRLYTRPVKYPPMDTDLRKRLQTYFLPEVEQLSALLRRDLTHWCRD